MLSFLLACTSAPPAEPPSPVPDGPIGIDLTLDCPVPFGTFGAKPVGEGPRPELPGATFQVGVDSAYAIALEEGPDGWSALIDIDHDGAIGEGERLPIASADSPRAPESFPPFDLPATDRSGRPVIVPVRVRTSIHPDGSRLLHLHQGCATRGTFPDGAPFGLRARSGVLDHDRTELSLDLDGDGDVDVDNRLATVLLGEGVVPWAGRHWALSFEGSRMVLTPTDAPVTGRRAGAPAPDFAAEATDGQLHDLARYQGKPLLLDFWATWCAPCIRAHPEVVALAKEHGIAVLGISADEDPEVVKRWLAEHPTPWPSIVQGPAGEINLAYGVSSWPSYALLDAEGRFLVLGELSAVRPALDAL